jgi:hypothetical protein
MKEFSLNKIKAAGTTVGDVYFPQTKLLLPFDGTNGATTTSDSSDENRAITLAGADISTAQSKFGGSSLSVTNGSGSNICSWDTAVALGPIFTVEFWFRRTGSMATYSIAGCVLNESAYNVGSHCGLLLGYVDGASATKVQLYASSNGSSWDQASAALISDFPVLNTWEHRALVRNGVNWHYYVNGTRTFTSSAGGSAALWTGGSKCSVGKSFAGGSSPGALGGNYDDFRITNGVERYSGSSFTPPSTAHLTSAGDVNKQIIVNSAADGVAIGTGGINQARISKAWVNFNGTGTVAIRDNYNVSSITDVATGKYTVNFSTAMADANYSAVMYLNAYHLTGTGGFENAWAGGLGIRSTTSLRLEAYGSSAYVDSVLCDLIVFGS